LSIHIIIEKIILTLAFSILFSACARVSTHITAKSKPNFVFQKPIKLHWAAQKDELIENDLVDICKMEFVKNPDIIIENEDCNNCIIVNFSAERGGSSSYSTPGQVFNYQTAKYEDGTVSKTEHERTLSLKFFFQNEIVHQINGVSWGSNKEIRKVLPEMCASAAEDFPKERTKVKYRK
jgi:hypothetical protein